MKDEYKIVYINVKIKLIVFLYILLFKYFYSYNTLLNFHNIVETY